MVCIDDRHYLVDNLSQISFLFFDDFIFHLVFDRCGRAVRDCIWEAKTRQNF